MNDDLVKQYTELMTKAKLLLQKILKELDEKKNPIDIDVHKAFTEQLQNDIRLYDEASQSTNNEWSICIFFGNHEYNLVKTYKPKKELKNPIITKEIGGKEKW